MKKETSQNGLDPSPKISDVRRSRTRDYLPLCTVFISIIALIISGASAYFTYTGSPLYKGNRPVLTYYYSRFSHQKSKFKHMGMYVKSDH